MADELETMQNDNNVTETKTKQDSEIKIQTTNAEIDALPEPTERNWAGKFGYHLGSLLIKSITKFEVRGAENLPKDAPYIIAPNHETYVDGLIAAMGLPKDHFDKFCSLAAKELGESRGWFGKLIMRVGRGIPIDRGGSARQSLMVCIKELKNDNILLIHPEGTRTADGKLGIIKGGTSFIASKADVPIVPAFIDGGYEIFSRHMKWPRPFKGFMKRKRLILTYGKPIYPSDYANSKEMNQALSDWLHYMYNNKEIPREYEHENLEYMQKLAARQKRREQRRTEADSEMGNAED